MNVDDALAEVERNYDAFEATLAKLTRIAGVSARSFPAAEVRRSAEATADVLRAHGIDGVRLLEVDGAHPAVYGERRGAGPTLLIYGHHDVQPPGRAERWTSPPFEPEVRDGRMYGRGTSDDKGGFLAHLAAVYAFASLPVNVKFLIEGEEEIGSPSLEKLLAQHRDLFACDYIVLCDTPNFATGVPALTYRLRGNCIVDVEVRALTQPVHSGKSGGLVPDPVQVLCGIIAKLDLSAIHARVHVDDAQLTAMRALPFDEATYRADVGLVDDAELTGDAPYERLWARPSLTVTAIEAVPMASAANQIADAARARLSLRTVRDLGTREAGELLVAAINAAAPRGVRVTTTIIGGPSWWEADPSHEIFAVARRALEKGFGAPAVTTGSGGSIGFVQPFAALAGDTPPLLTGVQDPPCNAHSENESIHLGDYRKAMRAAVHLYEELARYDSHSHAR
jgi:acetylornithine deacetylase/succinyl-diaminopimelate desuccinylase-like protein